MRITKTLLYKSGSLWVTKSNKHPYIGDEGNLIRPIRTFLQLIITIQVISISV